MEHDLDADCIFEVEYTETGEMGLQEQRLRCKKNAKHENFYPVSKFIESGLPKMYQTSEVISAIKIIVDLTVRIRVPYTSMSRPAVLPETDQAYSSAEYRGVARTRVGTGFIGSVKIVRALNDSEGQSLCPCYICKKPKMKTGHREWGEVTIITAAHVVCTADELVQAEMDCFYDDDESKDSSVKILYGDTMRASKNPITKVNFNDDFCQFVVITHDIELCERLSMHNIYDLVAVDSGFKSSAETSISIVVSHPHGSAKCISWGDWTYCDILQRNPPVKHRYRYNAATCPGSSGALVWILERSQHRRHRVYVHSSGLRSGLNSSGKVDVFGEFISSDVPCHIS